MSGAEYGTETNPGRARALFYGIRPRHALLLGVWRIEGVLSPGDAIRRGLLGGSFEPLDENWGGYYHELRELDLPPICI